MAHRTKNQIWVRVLQLRQTHVLDVFKIAAEPGHLELQLETPTSRGSVKVTEIREGP